ncbi:RNA ligase family protein [Streptomyces microflavus]|uniref:RNA ligase domain-containing protein n=1 Tax=Streptomyces microflavus TaxID=1919 RepID=A0A7J0D654_STRMI|nr:MULTISPECIES: RNA ligase family protein [Streptomyces]MDX2978161.1 RNA ligase family protein [Streptomyces sp. NRRL_B-2249]GFN09547.1 hypothetical protein Smic_81030 [Streptomyces microflavus]GGX67243.1 hypothetical protein GCM10010298_34970 [Streptomyces microflavus]
MSDFTPDFREWPKTPRLFREIVITEKLDGTNAGLHISEDGQVVAQSRKRIITPDSDNYGFARWGQGIQRRYGMDRKMFSIFNVVRWGTQADEDGTTMKSRAGQSDLIDQVDAVPILYRGVFDQDVIDDLMKELREHGSYAAPGFMNPEGICVYHSQTRSAFKVTLDANDAGKWEVTA